MNKAILKFILERVQFLFKLCISFYAKLCISTVNRTIYIPMHEALENDARIINKLYYDWIILI